MSGGLDADVLGMLLDAVADADRNLKTADAAWREAVIERDHAIYACSAAGLTAAAVQQRIGVSRAVVTRALRRVNKRHGVPINPRKVRT